MRVGESVWMLGPIPDLKLESAAVGAREPLSTHCMRNKADAAARLDAEYRRPFNVRLVKFVFVNSNDTARWSTCGRVLLPEVHLQRNGFEMWQVANYCECVLSLRQLILCEVIPFLSMKG
ncbi:hypothetical protein BLNAU_21666 [Blattamonas nauphoetae]|uniref:Uncharacterized protein n=1 Tax=Blattamonas nauphoetae TaxID=2049346 RepID=A0ABQ9WV85_9EUKA|nr:hypothetical protein BLNAU_21666 [Blattamonas nauphoetae]